MERLIEWLDDPGQSLIQRASAAALLRRAGSDPRALASLLAHANDPSPMIRYYVVGALSAYRDAGARTALRSALSDPRRTVRLNAYQRLLGIQPDIRVETGEAVTRVRDEFEHFIQVATSDDPRGRSELALQAFRSGYPDEAERLLRERLALTRHTPEGYADLAQFLIGAGRLDEAEPIALELQQVAPGTVQAGLVMGTLEIAQGKPDLALQTLQKLVDAGYTNADITRALEAARRQLAAPSP